jgi:DNA-binding NarL/FixJ family response regulator
MVNNDPIWILDSDAACIALYHQTVGLQYPLRVFSTFEEFSAAFREAPQGQPRLLIVEPEEDRAAVSNFFSGFLNPQTSTHFPQTMIVSKLDDIDMIRFYLRVGVRDYILKPLRPNELVAKVERALLQINNRSILIFRNELDGQQVTNLTFREHQILTVLLNKPSRTCPREMLLDAVWNKTLVNRKTLDVHVFNLRRKLRPMGYDILCKGQQLILTKLNTMSARN